MIVVVEPARALECLEYVPHEFAALEYSPAMLQKLLIIYPPQHSLHVARVLVRYFGVPKDAVVPKVEPSCFWSAGRMPARLAEEVLSKRISGTFLVRVSESTVGVRLVFLFSLFFFVWVGVLLEGAW